MTQRIYITDGQDIAFFRTRSGKSVHIQHGVEYRDLLGEKVTQEEQDETNESMIGWMLYERFHGLCGKYSDTGLHDPDRGAVYHCEDEELCFRCMSMLDDEQRCILFSELTAREYRHDDLISRTFHG